MARLWNYFDGEPYMDNPRLFLFNKPRKKAKRKEKPNMAKKARRAKPRRRISVVSVNKPRRKHRRNPPAHRPRRNPPDILGFKLEEVLYGAGAVLLEPILEKQLVAMLPTSLAGTSGRWLVKVGASAGLVYVAGKAFGKRVQDLTMIALGSNLMAEAVNEFLIPPTVTTTTTTGAYLPPAMRVGAYLPPVARVGAYLPAARVGSFTGPSRVTGPFPAPF